MNEIISTPNHPSDKTGVTPRVKLSIREATTADVAFIDRLQKAHSKELGFLPTKAIEGKITLNQVLIAEAFAGCDASHPSPADADAGNDAVNRTRPKTPVGYLIAADRYSKRDEIGYVTQINVVPEHRRSLVAGALLQAQFDRSAYGCRLYCCWCAQDLKANAFWEAMGFTPIAFRTGSRTKGKAKDGTAAPRIHIFWQKRVRDGDVTTPWWYPAKTEGGEMRADRLVFPIPPGVQWRDVLPIVLPEITPVDHDAGDVADDALPPGSTDLATTRGVASEGMPHRADPTASAVPAGEPEEFDVTPEMWDAAREAIRQRMRTNPPATPQRPRVMSGPWFIPDYDDYQPTQTEIETELIADYKAEKARVAAAAAKAKRKTPAKPKPKKVDARLIALARELRDRWAEQSDRVAALPGKYDVRRSIGGPGMAPPVPIGIDSNPRLALPYAA